MWQVNGTAWNIILADVTTGQGYGIEQSYAGPGTSAERIVEAPPLSGVTTTLGDYAPTVTFDDLAVHGATVGVDQLFTVQGGAVVSSPSALDLNGFTVAYVPVAPAAPGTRGGRHPASRGERSPEPVHMSHRSRPGLHR